MQDTDKGKTTAGDLLLKVSAAGGGRVAATNRWRLLNVAGVLLLFGAPPFVEQVNMKTHQQRGKSDNETPVPLPPRRVLLGFERLQAIDPEDPPVSHVFEINAGMHLSLSDARGIPRVQFGCWTLAVDEARSGICV